MTSVEIEQITTTTTTRRSRGSIETPTTINYVSTMVEKEMAMDKSTGTGDGKEKKSFQFEHERLVPFDLSLKTRCRFLSTQQFACSTAIKSVHESDSILNYAKFNAFYERLDTHRFVSERDFQLFILID